MLVKIEGIVRALSGRCHINSTTGPPTGNCLRMSQISFAHHRFPPAIIQRAVWLYFRFLLSFRDVEEMLAERGINVSYETIRRWVLKFGPAIAATVRTRRLRPSGTWNHNEVFIRIGGKRTYLWRFVDDEGEVLEVLVQSRRNIRAALKLMRKLFKKQRYIPDQIVTDKLGSYSAVLRAWVCPTSTLPEVVRTIEPKFHIHCLAAD